MLKLHGPFARGAYWAASLRSHSRGDKTLNMYGRAARGDILSSMCCSVTSAAAYETYIWGSREWSEAPEVTAGPSWAIAEAALNQTHIHSLLQRYLKGHKAS